MNYFEISFGIPEHGWIEINIKLGQLQISMDTADTIDSITELCSALLRLSKGSLNEEVYWSNEPGYYIWKFEVESENLHFSIIKPDKHIISTNIYINEAIKTFALAIKSLCEKPIWKNDPDLVVWSYPFPEQQLKELEQTIHNK